MRVPPHTLPVAVYGVPAWLSLEGSARRRAERGRMPLAGGAVVEVLGAKDYAPNLKVFFNQKRLDGARINFYHLNLLAFL